MADVDGALDRVFELALTVAELAQAGMADRGLTRARGHVIVQLSRDQPMTQRQLAGQLKVTPRNVTGLLDALQAAGLVARDPHPSDRRATLVTLTPKGATLAAALRADHHDFAQHLFADIPAADLAAFRASLDSLLTRLNLIARATPANLE